MLTIHIFFFHSEGTRHAYGYNVQNENTTHHHCTHSFGEQYVRATLFSLFMGWIWWWQQQNHRTWTRTRYCTVWRDLSAISTTDTHEIHIGRKMTSFLSAIYFSFFSHPTSFLHLLKLLYLYLVLVLVHFQFPPQLYSPCFLSSPSVFSLSLLLQSFYILPRIKVKSPFFSSSSRLILI